MWLIPRQRVRASTDPSSCPAGSAEVPRPAGSAGVPCPVACSLWSPAPAAESSLPLGIEASSWWADVDDALLFLLLLSFEMRLCASVRETIKIAINHVTV